LALVTSAAAAQPLPSRLDVRVLDAEREPIGGARLVLRLPEIGERREGTSDTRGLFSFRGLPPGDYTLAVTAQDRRAHEHDGLPIEGGQTMTLDVVLQVGDSNQVVFARGRGPTLRRSDATAGDLLDGQTLRDTPLRERDPLGVAVVADRVVEAPGGSRGSQRSQTAGLFSVAGQRPDHTSYRLDGVEASDALEGHLALGPSQRALREISFAESNYPAAVGERSSGHFDLLTRSGSNRYHGDLSVDLHNERFDAHHFFADPSATKPVFDGRRWGASLGGPIDRDRTFFFVAGETDTTTEGRSRLFSTPTQALREGDFSAREPLCDPVTIDPVSGACQPFPGNRIPAHRLDPLALALLQSVPLPDREGDALNLHGSSGETRDRDDWTVRIDHRFAAGALSFLRFTSFEGDDLLPYGTDELGEAILPGFGRSTSSKVRHLATGLSLVLGARSFNQTRLGWVDLSGDERGQNGDVDFAGSVGLEGVSRAARDRGFPQIQTAGAFDTFGDPATYTTSDQERFEISNSTSVAIGRHQLEGGVRWARLELRATLPEAARGDFFYDGRWSGDAFADFLLGYPTRARSGVGPGDENGRTRQLHLWLQDEWRPTGNLTIEAGLRWEHNPQMRSVDNRLASLDLSTTGARWVIASDEHGNIDSSARDGLDLIPLPWVSSTEAGWDRSLLPSRDRRLAPRFGFAWTVDDAARTVVRGGYGLFLHQWPYSEQTRLARNLPFYELTEVDAASDRAPTLRTADILVADRAGTVGASVLDQGFSTEYSQQLSLGLQRMVSRRTRFEARFTHTRTLHAERTSYTNVPEPGEGPISQRRDLPELSSIRVVRFDGRAEVDALSLEVDRRFDAGFAYRASYTWSQASDDASDVGATTVETNLPQDVRDLEAEWAPASFDRRHRLALSGTLTLPFLREAGGLKQALGSNWRITGFAVYQTGAPFTVAYYGDAANVGRGPIQRPDVLSDPGDDGSHLAWFDTSAFGRPANGFGNSGRNTIRGPDHLRLDLSFAKIVRFEGRRELEIRIDVFNALNHTNFGTPARFAFAPDFGTIPTAGSARQLKLGARFRL
jgi:hypothetical protein